MSYIDKGAQWAIVKEATYNEANPTFVEADVVELINPTMDASVESIEREVLKNSLVKDKPIPGKETSSGSFGVELSSVIAGEINGDILFESGMGAKLAAVTSEAATVATQVVTVVDSGLYAIGQAVKLTGGAATEFAVIRTIPTGTTFTVAPTVADDSDTVEGLLSYTIAKPDTAAISLAIEEYFENATNQITYTYSGVVVTDMTLNFPVANIVKADFSVAGAGFDVATAVGDRSSICHSFDPYVAKNMTFTYDGVSYDVDDLSVNIASDVMDIEALTTDGITNKVITGKSTVGGSFGLEYEGTALFEAFQASTTGELFGTVSNVTTTALFYAPNVVISQSSKSIDNSVYKDSADFSCLSSDSCSDTVEDAITIAFS